nr:LON peptidase substrate-binding domain-containing protein [Chitinophagaceae bacterium]
MTKFIPLFPLNIVVFPHEKLNLHIFEPRYKQLIKDCLEADKEFGIVPIIKNNLADFGTTIKILSIEKEHEDGNLDIRTTGKSVFRILEIIQVVPDKLYMGAVVNYPENIETCQRSRMSLILQETRKFHDLLEVNKKYPKNDEELFAYDIGHYLGLGIGQEYELLTLLSESERQEYIIQHLKNTI